MRTERVWVGVGQMESCKWQAFKVLRKMVQKNKKMECGGECWLDRGEEIREFQDLWFRVREDQRRSLQLSVNILFSGPEKCLILSIFAYVCLNK